MAGAVPTIIVAQAETGDALQQGVVVADPHAVTTEETHVADAGHSEVFPPFDPSSFSTQLIWLAICFAVLYVVLSRVALPQIGSIIDARKQRIEGDLKEAERLRKEIDRAVTAYETALADARKDAQKIAEETRESIRSDIDGKRKAVETDLGARVSAAEASIQASKTTALGSVDAIAAETVRALVSQLGGGATEAEALAAVAEAKGAM